MVLQHFMLADNLTVWENIILGDEPGTRVAARHRRGPQAHHRARPATTASDVDPDALIGRPRRRRAPAGRDPQGALPRRPHHHPGRADRGARAAGGRRAVRLAARARGPRGHGHLHLAQARRGAGGGRRHHGRPGRPHRGRGAADRRHGPRARRADGGQRAPQAGHPRVDRDRRGGARRSGLTVTGRGRPTRWSTTSRSPSTGARWWASPASRATVRASSSRRSWASNAGSRDGRPSPASDCTQASTRDRREHGDRVHPARTANMTAWC